jgi:hypothetical protein
MKTVFYKLRSNKTPEWKSGYLCDEQQGLVHIKTRYEYNNNQEGDWYEKKSIRIMAREENKL